MQIIIWVLVFLICAVTIAGVSILAYRNRKEAECTALYRKTLLSSLDIFTPQMEIIFSFLIGLDEIKNVRDPGKLVEWYDLIRNDIFQIRVSMKELYVLAGEIRGTSKVDLPLLRKTDAHLTGVKRELYLASVRIIATVNMFSGAFFSNETLMESTNVTMAEIIYYLSNIVPILSDFSSSSNEVSKNIIMTMVKKFEIITDFSNQITGEIGQTMTDLMDVERSDSLAYVVKRAKEVIEDFESFFRDMQALKTISDEFVDKSVEKLEGISDIADSIEEIAETIKVISLNVSVEAANTGSTARGFQVLARDLREFAQKTRVFAQDVKMRVRDAMQTSESLKKNYIDRMNGVFVYVEAIKSSLESFGEIINRSFSKISGVIDSLRVFSSRIEDGIKEVIGQLQYYDVRSQEVDHIGLFIRSILEKFYVNMDVMQIDAALGAERKTRIRADILAAVEKHITTSSERTILEKYEKEYGIEAGPGTEMSGTETESNIIFF